MPTPVPLEHCSQSFNASVTSAQLTALYLILNGHRRVKFQLCANLTLLQVFFLQVFFDPITLSFCLSNIIISKLRLNSGSAILFVYLFSVLSRSHFTGNAFKLLLLHRLRALTSSVLIIHLLQANCAELISCSKKKGKRDIW